MAFAYVFMANAYPWTGLLVFGRVVPNKPPTSSPPHCSPLIMTRSGRAALREKTQSRYLWTL